MLPQNTTVYNASDGLPADYQKANPGHVLEDNEHRIMNDSDNRYRQPQLHSNLKELATVSQLR